MGSLNSRSASVLLWTVRKLVELPGFGQLRNRLQEASDLEEILATFSIAIVLCPTDTFRKLLILKVKRRSSAG